MWAKVPFCEKFQGKSNLGVTLVAWILPDCAASIRIRGSAKKGVA
jgi:hypothetical protein